MARRKSKIVEPKADETAVKPEVDETAVISPPAPDEDVPMDVIKEKAETAVDPELAEIAQRRALLRQKFKVYNKSDQPVLIGDRFLFPGGTRETVGAFLLKVSEENQALLDIEEV